MPSQGAPGIFIQKLAELTEWQRQQQEKLLREQETQRQILSKEQQRMCDVYGNERPLEPMNSSSKRLSHSPGDTDDHTMAKPSSRVLLDDIPLPLQKKNFNDFLQEKLHEDTNNPRQQTSNKPKKPFLKKGQGLSRFRLNPNGRLKHMTSTKRVSEAATNKNTSGGKRLECGKAINMHSSKGSSSMGSFLKSKGGGPDDRLNCTNTSDVHQLHTVPVTDSPLQTTSESRIVPTWAHVLSQEHPAQVQGDMSTEKRKRELEELRVFELLEQKAANSSFCSTSSAIAQLMSKSVQSTPIKPYHARHPGFPNTDTSLHVRFADTNDYKNSSYYSDTENYTLHEEVPVDSCTHGILPSVLGSWLRVGASTGSQSVEADREPARSWERVGVSMGTQGVEAEREPARNVQRDFRDTKAWSDDDSCVSSESGSQSASSSSNNETLTTTQHPVNQNATHPDSSLDSRAGFEDRKRTSPTRDAAEDVLSSHWQGPRILDIERDTPGSSNFLNKSDLLRTRLQELENEIETFRKENATLSKLRRTHELEVLGYRKEKKEAEKRLKEEHENLKIFLDAEKKKLAKEKLVYERYCRPKELKNHTSKAEREEIAALKIQVEHLREELVKKDSRWSATQVRTRDRLRQLESENSELKKQIQNLKRERQEARQFQIGLQNGFKTSKVSNTKVIHAINNHIGKLKPKEQLKNSFVIKNVVPKKPIPKSIFNNQLPLASHRRNAKSATLRRIQSVPDMGISSSLDDLSRSADNSSSQSGSDSEVELVRTQVGARLDRMRKTIYDTLYNSLPNPELSHSPDHTPRSEKSEDGRALESEKQRESESRSSFTEKLEAPKVRDQTPSSGNSSVMELGRGAVTESVKENGNREKLYEDGRKEIWYPNGNVKKVSSDKATVKMIYFNGDVKETQVKENVVKYYYAETRTWHTSYSDGQEILEFPNGQVERRSPNGSTEITFSNGCMRLCYADGRDEWAFPDGTLVNTTTTGEKVVQLSNGQREVHTLEHKRREYPDGTVKLVYPDGLQETRYANGRIRLRDKDGNLILDSAAEN